MLRYSKDKPQKTYPPRWSRLVARPCYEEEKYPEKCTDEGPSATGGPLTDHDEVLIRDQARIQHAETPEQIQGLTDAWRAAKEIVFTRPETLDDPEKAEELALQLATMIEPRNKGGYRRVGIESLKLAIPEPGKPPVMHPDQVPRAMKGLWMAYSEKLLDPDEWYKEFEQIHPLEDGNGRLGELFWMMDHVRRGQEWPETHPPDIFGTDKSQYSAPPSVPETADDPHLQKEQQEELQFEDPELQKELDKVRMRQSRFKGFDQPTWKERLEKKLGRKPWYERKNFFDW